MPLLALSLCLPGAASADERRVMATSFDSVRVDGPYEVEVRTGGATGAVVTGDAAAIDAVSVRVEDRTLVVTANTGAWGGWPDDRRGQARVIATAPFVRAATIAGNGRLTLDRMRGQEVAIAVTGGGTMTVRDIATDQLAAVVTGTATLEVAGKAARARFSTNGANRIAAEALNVRDLLVTSESAGDSIFSAGDTATVVATGVGSVTVTGNAACTVSGPGPVRCGR